jgi:hypothetical protein
MRGAGRRACFCDDFAVSAETGAMAAVRRMQREQGARLRSDSKIIAACVFLPIILERLDWERGGGGKARTGQRQGEDTVVGGVGESPGAVEGFCWHPCGEKFGPRLTRHNSHSSRRLVSTRPSGQRHHALRIVCYLLYGIGIPRHWEDASLHRRDNAWSRQHLNHHHGVSRSIVIVIGSSLSAQSGCPY